MHEYQRDHEDAEQQRGRGHHGAEPTGRDLAAAAAGRVDVLHPEAALRLQRYAGNDAMRHGVQRSKVHDVVNRPGGRPVPADIVSIVESGYGPMPADARMHTDPEALESAREVGAYAYASGRDIVIPENAPREVQLEEAFHLAQQARNGDVAHNDLGNGVLVSDNDDTYERQAQGLARQYAAAPIGTAPVVSTGTAPAAGAAASVQRSADDDLAVQRSAGDAAPVGSELDEEPVEEDDGA